MSKIRKAEDVRKAALEKLCLLYPHVPKETLEGLVDLRLRALCIGSSDPGNLGRPVRVFIAGNDTEKDQDLFIFTGDKTVLPDDVQKGDLFSVFKEGDEVHCKFQSNIRRP